MMKEFAPKKLHEEVVFYFRGNFGKDNLKRLRKALQDEKNEIMKDKSFNIGLRSVRTMDMYSVVDCFWSRNINILALHEVHLI